MLAAEERLKWILGGKGKEETEGRTPAMTPCRCGWEISKLGTESSSSNPSLGCFETSS